MNIKIKAEIGSITGTIIEKNKEKLKIVIATEFLNPMSKNQCYKHYDNENKVTLNLVFPLAERI